MGLGAVRLAVGTIALLAPRRYTRTFEVDPEDEGPVVYVVRLFGIRTVFLGLDLLCSKERDERVREAVFIHASDTVAAVAAGMKGQLPPRRPQRGRFSPVSTPSWRWPPAVRSDSWRLFRSRLRDGPEERGLPLN